MALKLLRFSTSLVLLPPSSSPLCMGAACGIAKSSVGVASMGVVRPELVMKSIVPAVMAGVLGINGLIIAVLISTGINPKAKSYYLFDEYAHLSSGLACGLASLSTGMAIGIVGDAGVSLCWVSAGLYSLRDLSNNKDLSGPLPPGIGSLKNLVNLILVGCNFSGRIPESIGSLQKIRRLY